MSVQSALIFDPAVGARPRGPADTRDAPGWSEAIGAAFRTGRDDQPGHAEEERADAWGELVETLDGLGYDTARYVNPDPRSYQGALYHDRIWADAEAAARAGKIKDLPSREGFEQGWRQRMAERQARDADTVARSGWAPWLVGAFGAGLTDPINVGVMALTGGAGTAAKGVLQLGLREAGINAATELAQQPLINQERRTQGRPELTAGEMALNTGVAAGIGFALPVGVHYAGKGLRATYDRLPLDYRLARAFDRAVPEHLRTPEQQAALDVLTRQGEVAASNPFQDTAAGRDAHAAKIRETLAAITARPGRPAPRPGPGAGVRAATVGAPGVRATILNFLRGKGYAEHVARGIAAGIEAESRSDPNVRGGFKNRALGIGQWLGPRRAELIRRYGPNPSLEQQLEFLDWELRGGDPGGREVLAARNEEEALSAYIGETRADGTGWGFMRPLHGAQRQGDIERGMAALGRAGELPPPVLAPDPGEALTLRPEALDAVRPAIELGGRELPTGQFAPEQIGVDAPLMQFKSGGDDFGVTERLQGIQQWDPMAAGMLTVWERADGTLWVADGHQRLGLARRMRAADPDQDIRLNAFVLREADGFTARDARVLTALKNIGEGTGSATDAAKVFRDVGLDSEAVARRLPPKSALVRDGKALARLSDEAFGAVVNDVIPESHGAAIGHLAPDPASHMALVDLLAQADPANRRQAEAIVRQAVDDGFHVETQEELFGARDVASALYAQKARVLDRTLAELRKLRGAFQVAARNAEALDEAGNVIDVSASEAAAAGNAKALGLVERLALKKGNAVNEIIADATSRLANGEPLARVVADAVRRLRQLDLADLERSHAGREAGAAGGAGDGAGGSGRGGLADGEDEAAPDGRLTAAERDELEAAGQGGFTFAEDPALRQFDDAASGAGPQMQAQSDWHDIRAGGEGDGPFGPIFTDVDPDDWQAVVQRLSERQEGEVLGALSHPEIGRIDVPWGIAGSGKSDGYGLAKLVKFHPDVVADLPDLIRSMPVVKRTQNRIQLETADHKAAVRLDWDGKEKSWLLTALRKGETPPATEDRRVAGIGRDGSPAAGDELDIGPLPKSDKADQPTFDLGDGKGPRTAADIDAELSADEAAIEAIRGCLK